MVALKDRVAVTTTEKNEKDKSRKDSSVVGKKNNNVESVNEIDKKVLKSSVSENFYLIKSVKKTLNEAESKRQIEIEKVNKMCEKEEEKDKKYIEALKNELLERYQVERDKCQKKLEKIKEKALKKIEQQAKKEQEKIEEMCKNEVLNAIYNCAKESGWFNTAVALYKTNPDFFNEKK